MLRFACPSCQAPLCAPEERGGAETTCPQCRQPVMVPFQAVLAEDLPLAEPVELRGPQMEPSAALPTACPEYGVRDRGSRILAEMRYTARATLAQAGRLITFLVGRLRLRGLRRASAGSQGTLGERLYHEGAGDPDLRERLQCLDKQMAGIGLSGATRRQFVARRMELLSQLAEPVLTQGLVPPQVEAEWQTAHQARQALLKHQEYLVAARTTLFPGSPAERLRVGLGFGTIAAALLLAWVSLSVPAPTPSPVAAVAPRTSRPAAATSPARTTERVPTPPPAPTPPPTPVPSPVPAPTVTTPVLVVEADGHTEGVMRVLFTPDGKQLITVAMDKTIRIWDVATGETVRILRPPIGRGIRGALRTAALSPNGKLLAVAGQRADPSLKWGPVYVISLDDDRVVQVLKDLPSVAVDLNFSPDGARLAVAAFDAICVFDTRTWRSELVIPGKAKGEVTLVAFSPDGRYLAGRTTQKTLGVWLLSSGECLAELGPHPGEVHGLAWSSDGKRIVTSSSDHALRFFAAPETATGGKLQGPVKTVEIEAPAHVAFKHLAFCPGEREILISGGTFTAAISNLETGRFRVGQMHTNLVSHASLSPDGKLVASLGGNNQELRVWRAQDGQVVQRSSGKGLAVWGVGWSADGQSIAWGNVNKGLTEFTAPLERTFRLNDLEFGPRPEPDCRRAVLTDGTYTLSLVNERQLLIQRQGRTLHTFTPEEGGRLLSCTLLRGNRAAVSGNYAIFLVDLTTGKQIRYFAGHTSNIMTLAPSPDGRYLVSGSSDQTVRIWDLEQQEPLLTCFVSGPEWIAWTREGYYAASAGGERLMGWHINNGLEALATYYPAAQFRKLLYRPDVIQRLLAAGSTARALALADKEAKRQTPNWTVDQVLPPEVRITSPKGPSGHRFAQPRLTVRATATSAGPFPVTTLRLLVDGRPHGGRAGVRTIAQPRVGSVDVSWEIELAPGKHTLVVQAETAVSKGLSSFVEVTRTGGSNTDRPSLYVLAVGVSAYPGNLRLNYAAADAEILVGALRARGGQVFQKIDVKLLQDRQATRRSILEGLNWLGSVMTPRDVAIVYFSGHGARDQEGNFYLVPVDANLSDLASSGVSGDQLKSALVEMPGRVMLILDACHSGAANESGLHNGKKLTDDLVRDLVTDDYGVVVMSSSLGEEYSLESPTIRQGFFTYALVEGLTGRADYNQDGFVHLHEVAQYTEERVGQLTRDQQHPVTSKPANLRTFPLASR